MLMGYARVSTADRQDTSVQVKALQQARVDRVFEEHASGGRWDRPELHRMLDFLREGDCVVVWKLDRLSRSLRDLLQIMDRITDRKAGFRSLTESIDTTAPAGRMLMQMLGSFADYAGDDPGANPCRAGSCPCQRPASRAATKTEPAAANGGRRYGDLRPPHVH